jgi:hypothetical protein
MSAISQNLPGMIEIKKCDRDQYAVRSSCQCQWSVVSELGVSITLND